MMQITRRDQLELSQESKQTSKTPALASRRTFLQSTGAAMVGGLASSVAISSTSDQSTAKPNACKFSSLSSGFVYLNSGTEGSMPDCVLATLKNKQQQWAADPTTSYEYDEVLSKYQHQNRTQVAKFLGVEKNNICLTDNTTMGCNMTLLGLNFRPDDKVITTNHEHNAIKSPLQVAKERQGLSIETRSFPPAHELSGMSADQLMDYLFPDTPSLRGGKALCVSHVYPTTGVRLPLALLRKKADQLGIQYLIVDGAQALGMVDLGEHGDSIRNCDFYAGPAHKWLNGPPATGVLYMKNAEIRPPEFYPMISQRMSKYTDVSARFPMAEALQVRGCSNTPGFAGMLSAMDLIENAGGAARVEKHIVGLSQQVKNIILAQSPGSIVSPHDDPALQSGLTTFFPFKWNKPEHSFTDMKTANWVVRELLKKNIQIRAIGFANKSSSNPDAKPVFALRVSTGYFNSSEQVGTFSDALQEVLTGIQ